MAKSRKRNLRNNKKRNRTTENSKSFRKNKIVQVHYLFNGMVIGIKKESDYFHRSITDATNQFEYQNPDYFDAYLDQLEIIKKNSDNGHILSKQDELIFCMNVYVLSKHNIIPNDDKNGVLLIYKNNGKTSVISDIV